MLFSLFSKFYFNENEKFENIGPIVKDLINKTLSDEEIQNYFDILIKNTTNILSKFGNFYTICSNSILIDTINEIKEDYDFFSNIFNYLNEQPSDFYLKEFMSKICNTSMLNQSYSGIISHLFYDENGPFQNILILRDKTKSEIFSQLSYVFKGESMEILDDWFQRISLDDLNELFPFQSNIYEPRSPEEPILWFLSKVAKYEIFFEKSMEILKKFSMIYLVNIKKYEEHSYGYSARIGLDQFTENCHCLIGDVRLETRWNYIKNLKNTQSWPEKYQNAFIKLKILALKTFMELQWHTFSRMDNFSIRFNHTRIDPEIENLEDYRKKNFFYLMQFYKEISNMTYKEEIFRYLISNLIFWTKYIPWHSISEFLSREFSNESKYRDIFRDHIRNLKAYDSWRNGYDQTTLQEILTFDEQLEENLSTEDYFRKYFDYDLYSMDLFHKYRDRDTRKAELFKIYENVHSKLLELEKINRDQIYRLILEENFKGSREFGEFFAKKYDPHELVQQISFLTNLIEKVDNVANTSDFLISLLYSLQVKNKEIFDSVFEDLWDNPKLVSYREKFLFIPQIFSLNLWNKFKLMINTQKIDIEPCLTLIVIKDFNFEIPIGEIRNFLVNSIKKLSSQEFNFSKMRKYSEDDDLNIYLIRIEEVYKKYPDILNNLFSQTFLKEFHKFSEHILKKTYSFPFLIECGKKEPDLFNPWLITGFSISEYESTGFLTSAMGEFKDEIYNILTLMFQESMLEEYTKLHSVLIKFEISGDIDILNKFNFEQLVKLYRINPKSLGKLIGRLLQKSSSEQLFNPVYQRLILKFKDNTDFNYNIFRSFLSTVRSYSGMDIKSGYSREYNQIENWIQEATNKEIISWLKDLKNSVDEDVKISRKMWDIA